MVTKSTDDVEEILRGDDADDDADDDDDDDGAGVRTV
jgi:hypothetical protein